jgi:hypothetical protein
LLIRRRKNMDSVRRRKNTRVEDGYEGIGNLGMIR